MRHLRIPTPSESHVTAIGLIKMLGELARAARLFASGDIDGGRLDPVLKHAEQMLAENGWEQPADSDDEDSGSDDVRGIAEREIAPAIREWWRIATNVVRMDVALGEPKYGRNEDEWRADLLGRVGPLPLSDADRDLPGYVEKTREVVNTLRLRAEASEREREEVQTALNAFDEVASAYMTAVRRGDTDEVKADTGKAMYQALFYAQPPQNALLRAKLVALGAEAKSRQR